MKFERKKGGKGKEEAHSCADCGLGVMEQGMPQISQKEAMKRLKEMEKSKVKSEPCPYLEVCDFKMLPQVGNLLCLDAEESKMSQSYMVHMAKHHMWEQCKKYMERKRTEEGVLPKDLKKALKEMKKKSK